MRTEDGNLHRLMCRTVYSTRMEMVVNVNPAKCLVFCKFTHFEQRTTEMIFLFLPSPLDKVF